MVDIVRTPEGYKQIDSPIVRDFTRHTNVNDSGIPVPGVGPAPCTVRVTCAWERG